MTTSERREPCVKVFSQTSPKVEKLQIPQQISSESSDGRSAWYALRRDWHSKFAARAHQVVAIGPMVDKRGNSLIATEKKANTEDCHPGHRGIQYMELPVPTETEWNFRDLRELAIKTFQLNTPQMVQSSLRQQHIWHQ